MTEKKQNQNQTQIPHKKFKSGLIEVAVWENERVDNNKNMYKSYSLSYQRSYQDDKEVWKNTTSMRKTDIPVLMELLKQAYKFLINIKEE